MKRVPVVQEEATGCGIASCAAIARVTYSRAKAVAGGLGISAKDSSLWSRTGPVRKRLGKRGYKTGGAETRFSSWRALPETALLAVKWHLEKGVPFWHWVVFNRESHGAAYVLDSKTSL